MGLISVSLPADGSTADVADYNVPVTTIVTAINGNLDNSNVASGAAISGSKLADASVTSAKVVGIDKSVTTTDSNPYKFFAYRNASLTAPAINTAIIFDTELYDTNNNFNNATGVYTTPVSGFYKFDTTLDFSFANMGKALGVVLYKNSTVLLQGQRWVSTYNSVFHESVSGNFPPIQLTAGDTIFIGQQDMPADGTAFTTGATPIATWFGGFLVSRT